MRSRGRLERLPRPSAVAIGNFDGFHAGHRRLVETLAARARQRRLLSVLLSFHPHPRAHYGQPLACIHTDAQRLEVLKRQAPDRLFFLDFAGVAGLSAAAFVRDVLLAVLRLRLLVVGEDFRFGHDREGDLDTLARLAAQEGFALERVPAVQIGGARVTSSRIRRLLAAGAVEEARLLLERPYFIDGVVERGEGRGRSLGFPTMNIATANAILPCGVFATRLELSSRPLPWEDAGGGRLRAATFIGCAPTFADPRRPLRVEAHVPGFRGSTYGRRVRLHFLRRLRSQRRFADAAQLAAQIRRDIAALGD